MAYIKEYWDDKGKRAEQAKRHTEEMKERFGNDLIPYSVKRTKVYDTDFTCQRTCPAKEAQIIVEDIDTVSAGLKYSGNGRMAMLNFASYKNPGGMFLSGSRAQEECLCHASFLYNVLSAQKEYYTWNNQHKNRALYLNRGLYTPNIRFENKGQVYFADVITCAAPNLSAARKYQHITDMENSRVLYDRIRFVLDIAKDNGTETLILGGFGCGVFGQDATEVAKAFKALLSTSHRCFQTVVFGIPQGRDGNLAKFQNVFCGCGALPHTPQGA